jgi:hypothetical protein
MSRDVLRQLIAAERLLARVELLVVAQHRQVHDVGADIDERNDLPLAAIGKLRFDQLEGRQHGVGFDVEHRGLRPADSATATRSSTFSLRDAAISTSISSGEDGAGPTT